MVRKALVIMMCLSIASGSLTPVHAIYQQLTEGKRLEAIDYGTGNTQSEMEEFIGEWTVVLKNNKGYAYLVTEFLALANEARNAILKGIALTPFDIDDAIARSSAKFVFNVTTVGDSLNFARNYTAVLRAGKQEIPTTFWTNAEAEGLDAERFVADSEFYFPSNGIDPNIRVQLVVQDRVGNPVAEFEFDLSRMR